MSPSGPGGPPSTERLVTYEIGAEETAPEAISLAFDALGTDIRERETTIHGWLPAGAVDALLAHGIAFRLQFVLWGHPVVVTHETVRVHAVPEG